ncbi:phospholipid phosphatase-related protein type 3-like protein [Lates japonicus]|uniref:Phospholipid phosphatase-related protein type 3-like protein n=1 Tax=Lates japonicus TaxID=270547 RepID=A0AAD3M5L2_LATJO|nr:phospholipid phosphatase-related protein type 3-like protein [Lates japonicus]
MSPPLPSSSQSPPPPHPPPTCPNLLTHPPAKCPRLLTRLAAKCPPPHRLAVKCPHLLTHPLPLAYLPSMPPPPPSCSSMLPPPPHPELLMDGHSQTLSRSSTLPRRPSVSARSHAEQEHYYKAMQNERML